MSTLNVRKTLSVGNQEFDYFSLAEANQQIADCSRLPFSLKVLLENLLRHLDNKTVTLDHVKAMAAWLENPQSGQEIAYRPARVLMQDFTGVPAVVDLAAMRDAMTQLGGDPQRINPLTPVDLVIDHSVQVDRFGNSDAFASNVDKEMKRNGERYGFLRWGQTAFDGLRVVPPGTGICHQVNLENLGKVVWHRDVDGRNIAYPDTVVGTDSHTTMINGLGILGWGVGGIEAEAAMLGQPISMLIPEVIGFKLTGKLPEGTTATDLVLTVTQQLRARGVVGKFVEFFGPGLNDLPLADRATIANMAPEYGATCGFFPVDEQTLAYLTLTGRSNETCELVRAYSQAQGLWRDADTPDPVFTDVLSLDLSTIEPCVAGPKRPQDRVTLSNLKERFHQVLVDANKGDENPSVPAPGADFELQHGSVVIAAITSCTNTSNPSVLMAAGLVAQKALEKGLKTRPWVKTSLAPGSQVVTDYLEKAGLQKPLDELGFNLVGYGCTTCIGNSGPLPEPVSRAIQDGKLEVSAVLSGNRNFEGRVHPLTKANWLASPPLVVAFALAGTTHIDITTEPLGEGSDGQPVYLRDIWPSNSEVAEAVAKVDQAMFQKRYANVFEGDALWQDIPVGEGETYDWDPNSTYVANPPFFAGMAKTPTPVQDVQGARVLALLGDSITTDHISPAGAIKADGPAGEYLREKGVDEADFNSFGSRRGNHEVMMRGTFANIRIRNEMTPEHEGGWTRYDGEVMSIYDAAMRYVDANTPLLIIAGKEYGTGSSRDWAAKGTLLLGVKAVIVESFERIHRSNLIGMGVLPLQFPEGVSRKTLQLDGSEQIDLQGLTSLTPRGEVTAVIRRTDGSEITQSLLCRIDTSTELSYYQHGGILSYVLRSQA